MFEPVIILEPPREGKMNFESDYQISEIIAKPEHNPDDSNNSDFEDFSHFSDETDDFSFCDSDFSLGAL